MLHPCELRGQFVELRLVGLHQHAHVIVNKCQFTSDYYIVLELDVHRALVIDQAPKVSQK